MIEITELHDALRFSGIGPDAPYHMVDSSHELKLRKTLTELALPERGEVEDLRAEVERLNREAESAGDELRLAENVIQGLKDERRALEDDLSESESRVSAGKEEIETLNALLAEKTGAAQ